MMVKLELSVDEINILLSGLEELPVKRSINLINKIMKESKEQLEIKSGYYMFLALMKDQKILKEL